MIVDGLFRAQGFSTTGTTYLALLVAEPYLLNPWEGAPPFAYFDTEHEVTYTGYARRTIAGTLAAWFGTQGTTAASSGATGLIRPAVGQYFPICTTSSEIVTHAALCANNTRNTIQNEVWAWWELTRPIQLSNSAPGFYPHLQADSLTIRLDN